MIQLRAVTKSYRRRQVLTDVSLRLRKGEIAFLTGPSGAGKTTLLRLIHMQTMPTSGEVRVSRFSSTRIKRRELPQLRRRVGFVFQDFRLLENLTAAENVAFALECTGTPRAKIGSRASHGPSRPSR